MDANLEPPPASPGDGETPDAIDITQIRVRRVPPETVTVRPPLTVTVARSAGETAMGLALLSAKAGVNAGRFILRRFSGGAAGRVIAEAIDGARDTIVRNGGIDWQPVEQRAEATLGRVMAIVVPVVVQAIDTDELMTHLDVDAIVEAVDVDAMLDQVDVNRLLSRVDIGQFLERVDLNALLDRVDIDALLADTDMDALLARVDVDALAARLDLNALLAEIDVDALLQRIDIEALLDRIDVNDVARRAEIGDLIAESTGDVAGSALDLARRQAVGLDTLLARTVNRVLGRDPDTMPQGPPVLDSAEEEEA